MSTRSSMSVPNIVGLDHSNPPGTSTFSLAIKGSNNEKLPNIDTAVPPKTLKLRSACDSCHRSKVRCSGGLPCSRCKEFATNCVYSSSARTGKPKGSRSRKTIEREKRAAGLDAPESEVAVSAESVGLDAVPRPTPSNSVAGISGSGIDVIPFSAMDTDLAAPSSSSDMSSMSWTTNDCSQGMGHDGTDVSRALGISSATFWDPNHIWTSNELDAHQQFFSESPSPITTSYSGFDSLALQRLLPANSATNQCQCQCLTTMAALVPPLTTLVGAMSAERTDQFLLLVRKTCLACNMYCGCMKCAKDAAAISLITTVIQLVVWLAGKVGVGPGESPDYPRLQLGGYNVCDDDEQQMLVHGLVACRLRKLLTAAKALRDTVQGLATSSEEEDRMEMVPDLAGEMALAPQLACFDQSLARLQFCQEWIQPEV